MDDNDGYMIIMMVILMIIIRNKNDKKHTHKVKIDLFQGLILGDKRAKKFRQCT